MVELNVLRTLSRFYPTYLFVLVCFCFFPRWVLCISGSLGTHYVVQAGLELTKPHLPLPPRGMRHTEPRSHHVFLKPLVVALPVLTLAP